MQHHVSDESPARLPVRTPYSVQVVDLSVIRPTTLTLLGTEHGNLRVLGRVADFGSKAKVSVKGFPLSH